MSNTVKVIFFTTSTQVEYVVIAQLGAAAFLFIQIHTQTTLDQSLAYASDAHVHVQTTLFIVEM